MGEEKFEATTDWKKLSIIANDPFRFLYCDDSMVINLSLLPLYSFCCLPVHSFVSLFILLCPCSFCHLPVYSAFVQRRGQGER